MSEIKRAEVYVVDGRKFDTLKEAEEFQTALKMVEFFREVVGISKGSYYKYAHETPITVLADRLAGRPALAQKIIKILEEW